MEKYYVIRNSEDGEISIDSFTKEELEIELDAGENGIFSRVDKFTPTITGIYDAGNNLHPNMPIIIKGKIIIPRQEKVITKYKVE